MPGMWIRLPGGGACHIKYAAPRRKRCNFCPPGRADFATRLCDFDLGLGVTCDAAMCSGCAKPVGPDREYCPNHAGRR